MSCFLEFSYLKPNKTVKSRKVTLYMTFERILKDFKVSYVAKTQKLPITFAQVPTISQLYWSDLWYHKTSNKARPQIIPEFLIVPAF